MRDLLYLYLKSSNYTGVLLLLENGRTTTSIFLLAGNGEKMLRCLAKICVYLAKYFFYIFCNVDNVALFFVRIQWNFSNCNIVVSYFFLMIVHVLCLSNVILFTFFIPRGVILAGGFRQWIRIIKLIINYFDLKIRNVISKIR